MPRSSDSSLLFKVLTFVVLWTSCLTASPVLSAQERGGCGNDPVVFSQRFLRAVYPELQDKNQSVSMVLHAGGPFTTPWSILSQFEVQVRKYPVGAAPAGVIDSDGKGHEVHNDVLAGGFFMCASEKPRLNSYVYK